MDVLGKSGADALRLYLINSPVVRAENLRFSQDGVDEVVKGVLLPWFNAFRFFTQCVERWEQVSGNKFIPSSDVSKSSRNVLDVWILASTFGLVQYVHEEMKAYRLYTVVPRLVEFIEELTNWYVRLNRDRLKGAGDEGEAGALLGLNVLFEVMLTMTLIMSPFTPFFTEYLYQHLRKLLPLYNNIDTTVPSDAPGKAASVHFLMLPSPDLSRVDKIAESRFKTLQLAVSLVRNVRQRKNIRMNLPLKNVVVVAANESDIEALNHLRSYFLGEINAWDITLSTDVGLCVLKTIPNWKLLGAKLGKQMKAVAAAVNTLTQPEILEFMKKGTITLAGFELTTEEIVIKREFNGDAKIYEASVSDDGSLLVAVNTTFEEPQYQELRASTLAASIQKLRKSAGLVVQDKVEIFFAESGNQVCSAVGQHANSVVKRLKTLPLPVSLMPKNSILIAKEVVKDAGLSASDVTVYLTKPTVNVDTESIKALNSKVTGVIADMAAMYLQTMDLDRVTSAGSIIVEIDGCSLELQKDVHYFASGVEMVAKSAVMQSLHPWFNAGV